MDASASEPNSADVPRYRVEEQIGVRGSGLLFKAWDEELQRWVAIHRFEQSMLGDLGSAAQDVRDLSGLKHPNIAATYALEEDAEGPFLVLGYAEGETLDEVVPRGAFPLEEFSLLARQSLEALGAAHALGLLHRSLKPGNFLVQWLPAGGFHLKLLNFGLAKIADLPAADTLQNDATGASALSSLSPEALQNEAIDERSDLYSLGCVFYFALTQQMPFAGATESEIVASHLHHEVVPLERYRPDLPEVIAQWVMQFIEREPAQRFHSAAQALAVFTRLLQAGSEEATSSDSTPETAEILSSQASHPPSERKWLPWITALIALAAVAVWFRGKPEPTKTVETSALSMKEPAATPSVAESKSSGSGLPSAAAILAQPTAGGPSEIAFPPELVLTTAMATPAPTSPDPAIPQTPPPAAAPIPAPSAAAPMPASPAPPVGAVLQPSDLEAARARLGTEVVVEGTVANLSANKNGDIRYLNFDRNFRNAIALVFFVRQSPEFTPEKLQTFVNQRVRVRGVVDQYKETLQIKVQSLTQIEVVP